MSGKALQNAIAHEMERGETYSTRYLCNRVYEPKNIEDYIEPDKQKIDRVRTALKTLEVRGRVVSAGSGLWRIREKD